MPQASRVSRPATINFRFELPNGARAVAANLRSSSLGSQIESVERRALCGNFMTRLEEWRDVNLLQERYTELHDSLRGLTDIPRSLAVGNN